jgi:hypothetical protein
MDSTSAEASCDPQEHSEISRPLLGSACDRVTPLPVQLPANIAAELVQNSQATRVYQQVNARGALAAVATCAAVIAGDAAVVVTLLSTPDVIMSVAHRLLRRREDSQTRWLEAHGPGGEIRIRLNGPINEMALATLLAAVWSDAEDGDTS